MASQWRENSHSTEVANLMEGEWPCYRRGKFMGGEWQCEQCGHFNGGRMVMLQKWSLYWRENGHDYRCGQFYSGRMVMLKRWSV